VNRGAVERFFGSGFSGRALGWFLGTNDIFARLARAIVTKEHRGKSFAHVPFEIVGEHTQKDVRTHAAFQTVMDGTHLEVKGLEATEGLLNGT
jgi:hypothetical protein